MCLRIYLVASIITAVSGMEYNATSPIEDFFLQSQNQLRNYIAIAELKIDAIDERSSDLIKLMRQQHQLVLQRIKRIEQGLEPLQVLSSLRKHCVQKYKPLLVSWHKAQKQYATCILQAQERINSLTTKSKDYLKNSKSVANTNFPSPIEDCNTTSVANEFELEQCALRNVELNSEYILEQIDNVDKHIEISLRTLFEISWDANQCSFVTEMNVFMTAGRVLLEIDNCVKKPEAADGCRAPNDISTVQEDTDSRTNEIATDYQESNEQNQYY